MAKEIAKLLKTDIMADLDLKGLAQLLQSKGRGKDRVLAHITPKEAALLRARGGRGSRNPNTGLLEFDDAGADLSLPAEATPLPEEAPPTVSQPTTEAAQPSATYTPPDYSLAGAPSAQTAQFPTAPAQGLTGGADYSLLPGGYQGQAPGLGMAATAPALTRPDISQTSTLPQIQPTTPQDSGSLLDQVKASTGLSGSELARLGIAGGLGLYNLSQQKKAEGQIQAAQAEQQAIAQPYQTQGQEMVRAAQAGELTPVSQQALAAYRAQQEQKVATTGGVGSAQAVANTEAFRQTLLNNQLNYGISIAQIGDKIALGAIQQGLQLDQQLNLATSNFYSGLANYIVGGTAGTPTAARPTGTA